MRIHTMLAAVAALFLFLVQWSEAGTIPAWRAGKHHGQIKVGALKRTYQIYIPKKSRETAKALPLVIVLHGGLGSAESSMWDSRMSKQADKDNFYVVYPDGAYRSWNADGCCGLARRWQVDDVAFVRALIAKLKEELNVDSDRIYVTGISNGGMMAYKLGCELSDQIAAIAPIEGCLYSTQKPLSSPVSVIAFHGKQDFLVPYYGGVGSMYGYKLKATPVADAVQYFVQQNHCNPQPLREPGGFHVERKLYAGGDGGAEVCLYTLDCGGHAWPGGRRVMFIGDKPRKDICATETMCRFFFAHPKQHPAPMQSAAPATAPPDNAGGSGDSLATVATGSK